MYEWIVGILGLFVVSILFIALNQAYDTSIYDYGNDNIRINASSTPDNVSRTSFTILDTIWNYSPILILFLFALFLLVRSQRRTPPYG